MDNGIEIEDIRQQMINKLSSKPVGSPAECEICDKKSANTTDAFCWCGDGWLCQQCFNIYIETLDMPTGNA